MSRYTRGTEITIEAENFVDRDGASVTPDSVTIYFKYPSGGGASYGSSGGGGNSMVTASYAMTNSSGVWSYSWDSSVAYPGTVYYSILAEADDAVARDGDFQLQANPANPDP